MRQTTNIERRVDNIKFAVSRLERNTQGQMTPERTQAARQYLSDLQTLIKEAQAAL